MLVDWGEFCGRRLWKFYRGQLDLMKRKGVRCNCCGYLGGGLSSGSTRLKDEECSG